MVESHLKKTVNEVSLDDRNEIIDMETDVVDLGTENEIHRNTVTRKSNNLTMALEKISTLAQADQRKILRRSLGGVAVDVKNTLLMTESDSVNEAKLGCGVLDYLKNHKCLTVEDRNSFCSLCIHICGQNLYDDEFFAWLPQRIGRCPSNIRSMLDKYLSVSTVSRAKKAYVQRIKTDYI